jgi:hypothetical protein
MVGTPQEAHLPAVGTAPRPLVILRLRDQDAIGSRFIAALEQYAQPVRAHGGGLMLAGVRTHQGAVGPHGDDQRSSWRGERLLGITDARRQPPERGRSVYWSIHSISLG